MALVFDWRWLRERHCQRRWQFGLLSRIWCSATIFHARKDRQIRFRWPPKAEDFAMWQRIFHATRLVSILEAYALYDPEIGYCQGMSDLLSPIISVISDDDVAFRCFVGFMRKARHNSWLDEVGIRRQLNIVSKIIKGKNCHLYRHLENFQAEEKTVICLQSFFFLFLEKCLEQSFEWLWQMCRFSYLDVYSSLGLVHSPKVFTHILNSFYQVSLDFFSFGLQLGTLIVWE